MATVNIKLTEGVVLGPGKDGDAGDVVSVDAAFAARLIARGAAEPAPEKPVKKVKRREPKDAD